MLEGERIVAVRLIAEDKGCGRILVSEVDSHSTLIVRKLIVLIVAGSRSYRQNQGESGYKTVSNYFHLV